MCVTKTVELTEKEKFSLAVRTLSDTGFENEDIAQVMNVSRARIAGVMAWKDNPDSWGKGKS